jgi:hypothetical protein
VKVYGWDACKLADACSFEELVSQADKADKMLHNLIEAYVPAHQRKAWHADKADLRTALNKFGSIE